MGGPDRGQRGVGNQADVQGDITPALADAEPPNAAWRMAHETAAAGYGFVWPRLVFASDGETVEVICHRTNAHPTEPIRYLEDFRESMPVQVFERTIDAFITLVLARLDTVGLPNTELAGMWQELREERRDPEASVYRRLEAQLGCEPDEAPAETVERLMTLSSEAGKAAILVPFPYAIYDHQRGNAQVLQERGAAEMMLQSQLTPERLAAWLGAATREMLLKMAIAARTLRKDDAAQRVADTCIALAQIR